MLAANHAKSLARGLCAGMLASALTYAPGVQAQPRKSDIQLSFEKASGLSGPQQVTKGEKLVQKMKDHLRKGFQLLEQARSEKDIVKLNAINEKLSSMKGLLKISEAAFVALQEAVARRDKETADHEYTKIAIASQKVEGLALEAEGAVGDSLHYTGDTRVEVTAEGMAAEGDVPTGGAGADVPAGAGAGAAGAAAGIAGGAETQDSPSDETAEEEGDAAGDAGGTDDDGTAGGNAAESGSDFSTPPVEDVVRETASPSR